MVMEAPIRSFFVTLKRGFAGTKESQIRILKSLGFRKREQCLEKENNASIRGALDKVKHLVRVETDAAYHARQAKLAEKREPRAPVTHVHQG